MNPNNKPRNRGRGELDMLTERPHIRKRLDKISGYCFSTWLNSSSTGVERPKISTATRRRLFS